MFMQSHLGESNLILMGLGDAHHLEALIFTLNATRNNFYPLQIAEFTGI
jgi:hypothetical protein